VREEGAKGATLVEVENRQIVTVTHKPIDVLRWGQMKVSLDGAESMAAAATALRFECEARAASMAGRPLLARITLTGETVLHAGFAADPAAIEAECQNAAQWTGAEIFVESVVVKTRSPHAGGTTASAELQEEFARGLDDAEISKKLLADFAKLRQDIPFIPGRAPVGLPTTVDELRELLPDAWHLAEKLLRDAGVS
jgi:hypothetical protein